jgi:hypothetical protein
MLTCLCRENADILIRSAVTKDGEIVGREAVVLMDCGAYGGEQIFLTTMTAHTLGGNYRLGAVPCEPRDLPTAPNGAFRAFNGVYNTSRSKRTDEICAHHRHGSSGIPPPQRVGARFDRTSVRGRRTQADARSHERIVAARTLQENTSLATVSTDAALPSALGSSSLDHRRRRFTSMPMAARRW